MRRLARVNRPLRAGRVIMTFLAACLVAGMIIVGAVMFPEFSDLGSGPIDQGAIDIILGFGFIFSGGLKPSSAARIR